LYSSVIDFSNPRDTGADRLQWGFSPPVQVLAAGEPQQVPAVLDAVQQAVENGRWCVGWLAYEAATGLDQAYVGAVHTGAVHTGAVNESGGKQPLAWFGVHEAPDALCPDALLQPSLGVLNVQWQQVPDGRSRFDADIVRIHEAIAAGDCYQINYTSPLKGRIEGAERLSAQQVAHALFARLRRAQPGGYAAMVDSGGMQALSVSPELFFDWDGERILTRPMKGTAPRGATPAEDEARVQAMRASPKERAENVMIVDLLRNDLSRIAVPHSVKVPRLFHAGPLPAVWQMTSDVEARTRPGIRLRDVFAALFPCGSITGAPKRQAMRLIRELEPEPRGIYCGALGVVRPSDRHNGIHATFNVPIRTVVLQGRDLRCGIGSGITAGATAEAEWQEWQHKQRFLRM
jgi:para-aminobenzoate synthetase component 1/para-aminobenzoate synthetase/4-amino-4-deoxychorismate lyase